MMSLERSPMLLDRQMRPSDALQVLARLRIDNQVVVTNQTAARLWPRVSRHQLDFNYNPSTMGGAVPLALGLAMAKPAHQVICISGDGALLMSLGSLVTVADSGATNLCIIVLDNGVYGVTGGQKVPSARPVTDLAGFARAAGFPSVWHFWTLDEWQSRAAEVVSLPGPGLIWLRVTAEHAQEVAGEAIGEQVARLYASLQAE
jgi:thiamine pyrophosphate-dependent acetolactate synthase large subunit-like protein